MDFLGIKDKVLSLQAFNSHAENSLIELEKDDPPTNETSALSDSHNESNESKKWFMSDSNKAVVVKLTQEQSPKKCDELQLKQDVLDIAVEEPEDIDDEQFFHENLANLSDNDSDIDAISQDFELKGSESQTVLSPCKTRSSSQSLDLEDELEKDDR